MHFYLIAPLGPPCCFTQCYAVRWLRCRWSLAERVTPASLDHRPHRPGHPRDELPERSQLDGVLWPPPEREDAPLVFVEAQFQGRKNFYARWLAAIFLFLYRHRVNRPWQAVVVFPHPGVDTGHLAPYTTLLECGLLRRVYLSDLMGREDLSVEARMARLIILDLADAPAQARALVTTPEPGADPLERLDLIETILVYKFPQLTREEIRAMLHLPVTDLKKTRFYQEVFGEGREEGCHTGMADLLLRQFAAKFGPRHPRPGGRA